MGTDASFEAHFANHCVCFTVCVSLCVCIPPLCVFHHCVCVSPLCVFHCVPMCCSSHHHPTDSDSNVLHIATMSGVLACLMRHFRASVSSLPLLSTPVGSLPIGTWSPDAPLVQAEAGKPQQVRLYTNSAFIDILVSHGGAHSSTCKHLQPPYNSSHAGCSAS